MVTLRSALLLLALVIEGLAASPAVVCQSKVGTLSIVASRIPRATTTIHNKITIQKKVIRKVNVVVVPRPKTTTSTTVKTITETTQADANIETAISTKTDTTTKNEVRLHTTTTTSTSYTTTTRRTTSTVPAPAGFIFAKSPDWRPRIKGRNVQAERAASDSSLTGLGSDPAYIQRVDCVKTIPITSIKVTTVTVQGSRVTVQPITQTKVITSIEISIETQYPPKVTETSTTTTVSTVIEYEDRTETATKTDIVTVESLVPAEPYYEACGDSNILSTANGGNKLTSADRNMNSVGSLTSGPISAYGCCVVCQNTSDCLVSLWRPVGLTCYIYKSSSVTCSKGNQFLSHTYFTKADVTTPLVFSNGPCGKVANGGNRT